MHIQPEIIHLPLSDIHVPPSKDPSNYLAGDWDEANCERLREDIAEHGLHVPIIVSEEIELATSSPRLVLRMGGHRLEAFRRNTASFTECKFPEYAEWTRIPAVLASGLTEAQWLARDNAENWMRKNPDWWTRAQKIHEIHHALLGENPDWTLDDTALMVGYYGTSDKSRKSHRAWIRAALDLVEFTRSEDPADALTIEAIRTAPGRSSALAALERRHERKALEAREEERARLREKIRTEEMKAEAVLQSATGDGFDLSDDDDTISSPVSEPTPIWVVPPAAECPILHTDFLSWARSYSGLGINLFHIDPPYGIRRHAENGQGSRKDLAAYDDNPEDLVTFLTHAAEAIPLVQAESAHMILWLPIGWSNLALIRAWIKDHLSDWVLDETPLIWVRAGSQGIAPAPSYTGRRNYEWAALLSRGRRKIIQVRDMAVEHPSERETRIHRSQKPAGMIRHFASMLVDDTTVALDPTAGSGAPLQAIHSLGARAVIGLERVAEIHTAAVADWTKYLQNAEITA